MDRLEFVVENKQNDSFQFKSVRILINETDLIDMLRKYELPFATKEGSPTIAGGYSGIDPESLFKYLTNPDEDDLDDFGRVSILECECGCQGCWPMNVKIETQDGKILWTDFEQPHRNAESHNHWDYSKFGQFEFDKRHYDELLAKLYASR